ncbi:autotransporter domain-containing protein [Psychrobacter urativorans]|uniref:Autotransporter domain-containing protein n=1 Tax=Psychrobacter urativorans TaxID=45610 RepID=A0A0M4TGC9_9GAMM|nr:autotransporter domain-containing protein [Psychrobacter urativorans]ALF60516.1 hypothetical protein AOC03_11065 [Psychrobacter urativorans]
MNHIYRIVFNRSLGVYQCVSEIAKTQGKSSGRSAITNRRVGFSLRVLSLSILSVSALGTTTSALAAIYNNGLTTNLGASYSVSAAGDEVRGVNTVVKANALSISETRLLVTDKGNIEIANTVTMDRDAALEIKDNSMLTADRLYVGTEGSNNNLNISTSGQLQANTVYLGEYIGSKGDLTVTGSNSQLNTESLRVGNYGKGNTTIANDGSVQAKTVSLGHKNTGEGGLIVTGSNSQLTTGELLIIGRYGKGSTTIANGGSVRANTVYLGEYIGSKGDLTVTGSNSQLETESLRIGNYGKGSTTITNGSSVQAKTISLGHKDTGEGDLIVTGSNSQLNADELLIIGRYGKGSATIANGGYVRANLIDVGVLAGSEGDLTVTGSNSQLNTNTSYVGRAGKGSATIADGGSVHTQDVYLGFLAGSKGNLTVTGSNSQLSTDNLYVGTTGKGSATVAGGGSIQSQVIYLGSKSKGEGDLTVTGSNSQLNTNIAYVGFGDKGSATIADGGSAQASEIYLGFLAGSEGDLTVTGSNSQLNTNIAYVGFGDKGSATIADGGSAQASEIYLGFLAGSEGDLTVTGSNSQLNTNGLQVGNQGKGKGTLNITDNGQVKTRSIGRGSDSKLSVINFDNGTLELAANQPALFNNFTSANTINLASGGGTIDTNEFDISVFNDARITGSGNFTKMGSGKLAMNSATKAWSGDTDINQGTLQLNGDYNMRKGEVLAIGLNTLTDYGQLKVTGSADISQGKLQVNAADAVQVLTGNPVWNNVVSANSLTGKFAAVNDNSPLVSFVADYSDANSVHLKMVRDATFVDAIESETSQTALGLSRMLDLSTTDRLGNNENILSDSLLSENISLDQFKLAALDLAGVLDEAIEDRVNNGNSALADALITNTLSFNKPKLAAAANELQPLLMGATNRIITDSNYATTEAIIERSLTNPNRGVWAKIIGSDSSHDEEDGIAGYDASSYGAIVGIDSPINDNLNLGVAFSYIDSDVDSNSRALDHEMKTKNWQILGYGNYAASEATQVNFHAGAGSSDVKGQRHITILTDATASSDYSVDTLQAGFGIGHRIGNELRNFTPFAQMNYARAESDGYRETGAGVYNLDVDENTYESLRWTAGVKMSQALTPKLALTGQLAAAIENGDRRSDITASFIGMPNANFTTTGQEIGREIGIVGVGLSYMPTANTKLSAGYRGEWRDNYNDQGASIALQTSF